MIMNCSIAIDTTRYDVYLHKDLLKVSTLQAASILAKITRQNEKHILNLLENQNTIITPARHIEAQMADELLKLNWTGLDIVPRPFRHYPEGPLAAHVLGYVNFDSIGQGGIEQKFQSLFPSELENELPSPTILFQLYAANNYL